MQQDRPRSIIGVAALAVLAAVLFAGFVSLGTWQVQRLAWKLDLIARVEQRLAAPPVDAPGRAAWPSVTAGDDEYRKVHVDGVFLHGDETLVQAVTDKGPGFWVLTPLKQADGTIVLVNRGYVDTEHRDPRMRLPARPHATVRVTGLLRISEPGGAFLRRNDPAHQRWFSRDVAAIAAAQQLPAADVAPYFIDADATPNAGGWPLGGLTVVRFHNSHLVYAITWYTLALMVVLGTGIVGRREYRLRRRLADA
jgi:surfeit locus 1 family protein